MAIFSDNPDYPAPDIAISICLILCCIVSTFLNPVVFLFNFRRPHTVQRVIFRVLSFLDFVTCLLVPIMVVNNALKPTDCLGRKPGEVDYIGLLRCAKSATILEKIYTSVVRPCIYLPIILTAVLTSARFYHIKYPLRDSLHRKILIILSILCGVETCVQISPLLDSSNISAQHGNLKRVAWWAPMQMAFNRDPFRIGGDNSSLWSSLILLIVPITAQIVGLVATLLTVNLIRRLSRDLVAQQSERNSAQVTKKILLLNTGSLVKTCFTLSYFSVVAVIALTASPHSPNPDVVKARTVGGSWMNFIHSSLGPCFISAINPLIFIIMTPTCGRSVRNFLLSILPARIVPTGRDTVLQSVRQTTICERE